MDYTLNQKIKLVKDHNGKALKNSKYGYVTCVMEANKSLDGFYTEAGKTTTGLVYLVQTSWSGGALWYTDGALKPAGGVHRLAAWRDCLHRYHMKYGCNTGATR